VLAESRKLVILKERIVYYLGKGQETIVGFASSSSDSGGGR